MAVRGAVFTLMAIVVAAFILSSERLATGTFTMTKAEADAAATRVSIVNVFVDTFEEHATNVLGTAGYFALKNISKKIGLEGEYIVDMNHTVEQCLRYNTLPMGFTSHECLPGVYRLNDSIELLADLAFSELGISTQYSIHEIWVDEAEPFEVRFWMNISYNLSDPLVSWVVKDRILMAAVDVTGIEDPIYEHMIADQNYTAQRTFAKTRWKHFEFYFEPFKEFYDNGSYAINVQSPSVLYRYVGLLDGSSCCGVESVVNWSRIPNGIQTHMDAKNWSYIDFHFHNRTIFNCGGASGADLLPFPDHRVRLDRDRILNQFNLTVNASFDCN
ncbi:MAG: hypothetical protein OXR66_05795 [Candidatus Woesearchaeota archaeon]|nr:hypothetical protein [Candidatus Woesearchaeota archaeon]